MRRAAALDLPDEERAALARDLIASLDTETGDPNVDALWDAEIVRRAREVSEGRVTLVKSEDVHADITVRIRARDGR